MGTSAPGVLVSVGASTGVPWIEVALIGAIVIVILILLAFRLLRGVERQRRRAASVAFERPVNAYRRSGRDAAPGQPGPHSSLRAQQMAPTFAASRRVDPPKGHGSVGDLATPAPTPAPVQVATAAPAGPPVSVRPPPRPGTTPRTAVPANLPPLAPAPPAP